MMTSWQGGALRVLCVVGLGLVAACGGLWWQVWNAWQGMPAEAHELGLPPEPFVNLLPQMALQGALGLVGLLLSLMTGALLVWLPSLRAQEHVWARRVFAGGAWAGQALGVLAALVGVGWQIWTASRTAEPLALLPPGVYALVTSFVLVVVGTPLLVLCWLSLRGLRHWALTVGRWNRAPSPRRGTLHRALGAVSDTLLFAAALLLFLGVYLSPAPLVELMYNPGVTELERVMAAQKPATLGLMVWALLLGGASVWLWRTLARQACDVLDPQVSGVARLARARHQPADF
ncbi:hypothetical protein [Deinococcus hohokamensis]|uniref:Glycerophosphoryl diester phosphodiesterase membrane domain-containing protein n=1 Tax=Deinococcus hohokamensis TaxID=309883 RepID=A0ABV9I9Q1_9DEIO